MTTETLVQEVIVTAEVMGTALTKDGARMFCADLSEYPEPMVLKALQRCRREHTGKLTLASVVARLDDGRPGANESWAMIPRSEADSVVWTEEMSRAYFAASPLLEAGDEVAARMAFIETYNRELTQARADRKPIKWWVSLGHDKAGRERAINDAKERGRLSSEQANKLLPPPDDDHRPATGARPIKTLLEIFDKHPEAPE